MPNEQVEKQQRTEFIGVLSQLMPQLSQMIIADPHSANLCGQILKFATGPFRAGRSLAASIDEYVATLEDKADQPRPDDAATAQNKAAIQIEQIKDQTNQAKIKQEGAIEAAKLKQNDDHKKAELAAQVQMKQRELSAKQGDIQERKDHLNLQAMHDSETHQQSMIKNQADIDLQRQKADFAVQQHQMKQNDFAQRAQERQAAQQFKQTNQGLIRE
jgi:hypothetical protein